MKFAKNIFVLAPVFLLIVYAMSGSGCAMMSPPTGGPKDTLPPVLISALPKNFTVNFNTNRILFTFDEYVTIDKIQENLIISPTPKLNPLVDFKLKTVTVKLKDTLLNNTTYQLYFGKAIKDVNEGNILKNFTYVFSTGKYVDSLQFSGRVIVANTGKPDSTIIVLLHKKLDDSAVINDRARYVTHVDSAGYFTFTHLAAGTYALYALKDESGTRKYLSKSQLFAFSNEPVTIKQETPAVTLYAYVEEKEKQKNVAGATKAPSKPDKEKEKDKRLAFRTNITDKQLDILGNLRFDFLTPLKTFDSTKLRFTDEEYKDITSYHLVTTKDTTHKTVELVYAWQPETKYNIIAQKDFAVDSSGRMLLKADTISFTTRKESDYGELTLNFKNIDMNKNPVILLLQGEEIKFSFPLSSRVFTRKLFVPGEYKMSILYDDNKNGVWDPGEFFGKHKQPEKVQQVFFNNKKKALTVKTAWDNDFDISL
jgi:Bacterial Ig-like domain/Polysaccharide lyase family 4, domain II